MPWTLAIDGGGTRTRAALFDENGQRRGQGQAGPSNLNSISDLEFAEHIALAIREAATDANLLEISLKAAVLGLAGIGTGNNRDRAKSVLSRQGILSTVPLLITNDIETAYAGAFGSESGIHLIAGTGSACLVKTPDEQFRILGGWGHLLGDDGSAYRIGLEALRLAGKVHGGLVQGPAFLEAVLHHYKKPDFEAVSAGVYQAESNRPFIADLAKTIIQHARKGNTHCRKIVEKEAGSLADLVALAAAEFPIHVIPPLCLTGGLATDEYYAAQIQEGLLSRGVPYSLHEPRGDALEGGFHLAQNLV